MMCEKCPGLEERIHDLEARLHGIEWEPPRELRLTCHQTVILQTLMAHDRMVANWLLYEATRKAAYATRDDVDPQIVKVRISQLRSKLRPYGLEIETIFGRGYRLANGARARLLNWKSPEQAAA